jgi:hypothetical protein
VHLLTSELGGVPGFKAYHSSITLGSTEYSFSPDGIATSSSVESHGDRAVLWTDMGSTTMSGEALRERLQPHFQQGSYDLLRKNCNAFSDAALVVLVDKRLTDSYKHLEKLGARHLHVVARIVGEYVPNPEADCFDLEKLCSDLRLGPAWAKGVHKVGDEIDPEMAEEVKFCGKDKKSSRVQQQYASTCASCYSAFSRCVRVEL